MDIDPTIFDSNQENVEHTKEGNIILPLEDRRKQFFNKFCLGNCNKKIVYVHHVSKLSVKQSTLKKITTIEDINRSNISKKILTVNRK